MRTKPLIIAAAVTLGAVASAVAQSTNVYSVNVVGYINRSIPTGFSMVANQLNATNNSVTSLFGAPPNGTTVYKFNPASGGYDSVSYIDGAWEGSTGLVLSPGEGAFVQTSTAFTATFVGDVVLKSTNSVPAGFSIRSSVVPQSGAIDTVLKYTPGNNDTVYLFNPSTSAYNASSYIDGAWEPSAPVPTVGESFFIFNAGAAKSWVRNFDPEVPNS